MKSIRKISGQPTNRHSFYTRQSQLISVLCLPVLIFYLIRPAVPFVEYILFKDYIAKNLCVYKDKPLNSCHGKCYLHEQLKKNSEPTDSNKDENKKIASDKQVDDHLKSEAIRMKPVEKKIQYTVQFRCYPLVSYLPAIFTPPRF
ncbi:MAG: hypothetical protein QM800_01980 [Paludibacter sp.]